MPSSFSPAFFLHALRHRLLPLAVLAGTIAAGPWLQPAAAQMVIGGATGQPEVQVNTGVLDSLGPAPNLPDLLRRREHSAGGTPLAERPQRHERTAAVHLRAPRHKEKEPKRTAHAVSKKHSARKQVAHVARPRRKPPVPEATVAAAPRVKVAVQPLTEKKPAVPAVAAATPSPAPAAASAAETTPSAPTAPAEAAAPAPAAGVSTVSLRTPPVAPPSPVPTVRPSAAVVTAIRTPPAVPMTAPIPSPVVTPAAAPAALAAGSGLSARILFAAGAGDLPDAAKSELTRVVQRLKSDDQARLQLMAYANGGSDESNQARRLSLTRALAVRTYLMEQGVRNSRMDVRALGNHSDGNTPPDRVDVVVIDR